MMNVMCRMTSWTRILRFSKMLNNALRALHVKFYIYNELSHLSMSHDIMSYDNTA